MNKRTSLSRIDEQVFITMAVICLLCLIILGFRFAARTTCVPVQLIINAGSSQVNSPVTARAVTKQAASFEWDMGDGTTTNETTAFITHTYKQPGRFTIRLLVNGRCEELRDLVINDAPDVIVANHAPTFICVDTAYVNKPVVFEDTSSDATSWEWRFEAGGLIDGTRKKVQHVYYYPGRKSVTVKLNGRDDRVSLKYIDVIDPAQLQKNEDRKEKSNKRREGPAQIVIGKDPVVPPLTPTTQQPEVKPVEPAKPAAPKKVQDVNTTEMGNMLKGISDDNNQVSDVTGFFCNPNITVVYEGDMMPFSKAVEKLKSKKGKIKRVNVSFSKEAETNCISTMKIDVKFKFLGM